MRLTRLLPLAASLALFGCFGGKAPDHLLTLAPAAAATDMTRTAVAAQAVSIDVPVTPKSLKTTRVPVEEGETSIAYVKDLTWVDMPERLFQQLLSETLRRTSNRVVLDPRLSTLDAGVKVSGELSRFGYETNDGAAVVRYDAVLAVAAGNRVETRRFEAREPCAADGASVGPALNRAANRVAADVATWIGSHG